MTRKKVKLAYIANDAARKATFKKRKKGLMKKVSELSTLCGIEACAIIYSPYDSQPEVWPSPMGVQRVLSLFRKMPEMEQSKKMVNQETFLRQRIAKSNEQLKKLRRDNREKEMSHVMFQSLTGKTLYHLNLMDLNDVGWLAEQHLKAIDKRIDALKSNSNSNSNNNNNNSKGPVPGPAGGAAASSSSSSSVAVGPSAAAAGGQHNIMHATHGQHQQATADQRSAFSDFNVNMDSMQMQRQPWFMDLMKPQDHLGFGPGEEMMLPFGDPNHSALWSNAFFP